MKNPVHPGEVVRNLCLEPLELSVTKAADVLGVGRKTLSELLNGKSGISAEMAVRLAKAFGGSTESWMRQQLSYDLAQIEKRSAAIKVKRYEAA